MGIILEGPWPPGAFDQATLIARSLLKVGGGEVSEVRVQLVDLVSALFLPRGSERDVAGLVDQVLA